MGGDAALGLLSTKNWSLSGVFNQEALLDCVGNGERQPARAAALEMDMGILRLAQANQEERLGHKG